MTETATGIGLRKSEILLKVQIPLAIPVIMAGIRISAVTAVGLMTIAAFIGGGDCFVSCDFGSVGNPG